MSDFISGILYLLLVVSGIPGFLHDLSVGGTISFLPVASIFGGLFGLFRDFQNRHHQRQQAAKRAEVEKELLRLRAQFEANQAKERSSFDLSVTSHMATVAFDKYVEFCESYLATLDEALMESALSTPNQNPIHYASKLAEIRRKYALWEPKGLASFLDTVQKQLHQLGVDERRLSNSRDAMTTPADHLRNFHNFYTNLNTFIGIIPESDLKENDVSRDRLLTVLRNKLGADNLADLRIVHVAAAAKQSLASSSDPKQIAGP